MRSAEQYVSWSCFHAHGDTSAHGHSRVCKYTHTCFYASGHRSGSRLQKSGGIILGVRILDVVFEGMCTVGKFSEALNILSPVQVWRWRKAVQSEM